MVQLMKMIERVAPSTANILVLGESGTGKELIAKAIHEKSNRRSKAFVAINCGALRETLLESELFGHEKGSFTGAYSRKIGLAEAANGGTLLLDEIGELSPGIQAKLLRFIQEGEIYRVGGKDPIQVDIRLISATNRDLEKEVSNGNFREDLVLSN
jgi:transcriptional regulator with GAF, ATPase, and Fis domain